MDTKIIDSINEVASFRDNLIHKSPNPSLEMYLEIIEKLELINLKLIGLILNDKVEERKRS